MESIEVKRERSNVWLTIAGTITGVLLWVTTMCILFYQGYEKGYQDGAADTSIIYTKAYPTINYNLTPKKDD